MKEVLRLVDATQQGSGDAGTLRSYNLEIYAGDIVVVHGMAGSGLNGLLSLLNGTSGLTGGRIYINEQLAPSRRDRSELWEHISIFGDTRHQFEQLTVAENLALFSDRHRAFSLFNRRSVEARAARYLKAEALNISPDSLMASLSFFERQQMNLLMAKMAHASLIVMDCTEASHGEDMSEALLCMIRRFQSEGMAFLLISYRDSFYDGLATRFQKIAYGTDVMERDRATMLQSSTLGEVDAPSYRNPMIEGICDEAVNYMNMRDYLCAFRNQSPEYWERTFRFPIPPEGQCAGGGVVLIPKESAHMLPANLSVEDNVTLTIPKRIRKNGLGSISSRLSRAAAREFYRITGIGTNKREVNQLTLVERKILSLYRWEQCKPDLLVLAIPHYGMDRLECAQLDRYLLHLVEKGIHLLVLSDSIQDLSLLCRHITLAEHGQNARDATEFADRIEK